MAIVFIRADEPMSREWLKRVNQLVCKSDQQVVKTGGLEYMLVGSSHKGTGGTWATNELVPADEALKFVADYMAEGFDEEILIKPGGC